MTSALNDSIQQRRLDHAAAMTVVEAEGLEAWLADHRSQIVPCSDRDASMLPWLVEWTRAGPRGSSAIRAIDEFVVRDRSERTGRNE